MKNVVLGFLMLLMLFITSCVTDSDFADFCLENNTGSLTIINATSGTDGIPMEVYINGIFTGVTIEAGEEYYENELSVGTYEIEGFYQNGMIVTYTKVVYLSQCDDLTVELERHPNSITPCFVNNTGNMTIKNVTAGSDSISMNIYINGVFTGATIASSEEYYEGELLVANYEIEGRDPNGNITYIKVVNLLQCDDLLVELGN
ncbi:MAG: hypothetical protein AB8G11_25305 [Saprospiraceae bacterium]